jgi:hypothetical protein
MSFFSSGLRQAFAALVFAGCTALTLSPMTASHAQVPAPAASKAKWKSTHDTSLRTLTYEATVTLLGKQAPITVTFTCDVTNTKSAKGFLSVDVNFLKAPALRPFNFDNFEGPDATTNGKKPMTVTVASTGKAPLTRRVDVSGSTPDVDQFVISFGTDSNIKNSFERQVVRALADGAETIQITITDPRDARLKLDITIPVADKQAEFKALITDLRW